MDDGTDMTLQQLQQSFEREVPLRLRAIRSAYELIDRRFWQPGCADLLLSLLHKLTGAAGTLGQQSLSVASRQLYAQLSNINVCPLPDRDTWNSIGRQITKLEQLTLASIPTTADKHAQEPKRVYLAHPSIYVVDDDELQTNALKARLESIGYRVTVFNDTASFSAACEDQPSPSAIIMDMEFSGNKLEGAKVISEMKADVRFSPTVMFLSVHDDLPSRLAAFRAGANRYFTKPCNLDRLCQSLDELTGRIVDEPYRVLIVDDDEHTAQTYALGLRDAGMVVEILNTPLQTLNKLSTFKPDVLLLDIYMPDATGPEIAAVIRENENYSLLPIIFLSSETDPSQHAIALSLGGDQFLVKPIRSSYLTTVVRSRAWRARRNEARLSVLSAAESG